MLVWSPTLGRPAFGVLLRARLPEGVGGTSVAAGEPPRLLAALLVARVVRLVDMVLKERGGAGMEVN